MHFCAQACYLLTCCLLREFCYNFKATGAARRNHRSVVVSSTQRTCFAVHCDACNTLALRCAEGNVQLLREFARWRQCHGCDEFITTSLQLVADVAVACGGLFNRNRLACRNPIARDGTAKVKRVLVVVLEDQHPAHEQWNRLLCGNAEDGAAAGDA